jgi:hypothetical protein
MFFRKAKLIQLLRAEIQYLRELLARTEGERDNLKQGYEGMREIAAKALEVAKERCSTVGGPLNAKCEREAGHDGLHMSSRTYLADYVAPEVKNCPECSVSVRSETWPMECPACHCTFGFEKD